MKEHINENRLKFINNKFKVYFILILLININSPASSKSYSFWGLQLLAPTIHTSKSSMEFGEDYSYKLDRKGKVVLMPGFKVYYDSMHNSFLYKFWRSGFAFCKD